MRCILLLFVVLFWVGPLRAQSAPSIRGVSTRTKTHGHLPSSVAGDTTGAAAASDSWPAGAERKVDTMAALRALPVPTSTDSSEVDVRGYYCPGDGGGGLFLWDAGSNYAAPTGATMNAAGSDYTVGSVLRINAANTESASMVYVSAVNGNGAITAFQLCPGSHYTAFPSGALPTSLYTGTGSGATFTLTGSTLDDGGAWINPAGHAGLGRYRRVALMADPTIVNVRWFGAKCENIYAPTMDSLPNIQQAIWSAPDDDYLPAQYPGAGHSGHQKKLTLYFPGGPQNFGYSVSNTIYASAEMYFKGDGLGKTNVGLTEGTRSATETWAIKYCYGSNSPGNANTTFDTGVSDLNLFAEGTNQAGLFFVGCNGGYIRNVAVVSSERSIYVDSGGVVINNIRPTSVNQEGLEIHGQQIVGDYWDVEHCNSVLSGRKASVFPKGTVYGFHDIGGQPIPAILIDAQNVHVGNITGETSPVVVTIVGPAVSIDSVSDNTYGADTDVPGGCMVRIWDTDNVSVRHASNTQGFGNGYCHWQHGAIYDTRSDGSNFWDVEDGGTFGGRTSYSEQEDILNLRLFGNRLDVPGYPFGIYSKGVESLRFDGAGNVVTPGGSVFASSFYADATVQIGGFTNPAYGLRLHGYNAGSVDQVGPDGRYRLQIGSLANGNYTSYGEITKTGWGVMKTNPDCALDVNGDAKVSGRVSCGTLNVRSLPTSPTGLKSGDIYRGGNTLMIVP